MIRASCGPALRYKRARMLMMNMSAKTERPTRTQISIILDISNISPPKVATSYELLASSCWRAEAVCYRSQFLADGVRLPGRDPAQCGRDHCDRDRHRRWSS